MTLPIVKITRSSVLAGQRNGQLDPSILETIPGRLGGPAIRLITPATRAWRAMDAAAFAAGIILKASGPADSYRPLDVQVHIFLQRYSKTRIAGAKQRTWNGITYWQRPGTAAAAVPGTSNHGWACAVDVGTELDGDAGTESIDDRTLAWLLDNADRFGWSWELQSERWHIRLHSGDKIPAAVIAYENDQEDEPMASALKITWFADEKGNGHAYHNDGLCGTHLASWDAINRLRFIGTPEPGPNEAGGALKPLDKAWADTLLLFDGPIRNVPA